MQLNDTSKFGKITPNLGSVHPDDLVGQNLPDADAGSGRRGWPDSGSSAT